MDRKQHYSPKKTVILLVSMMLLWLFVSNSAFARMCWVDLYEYPQQLGAHIRIVGPIRLANLRDIHGTDWENRIDSLIVGKGARVSLFELPEFQQDNNEVYLSPSHSRALGVTDDYGYQQAGLTFSANEEVEHLGVWGFHKKAKSLIVDCIN
ncbi:MAG TPA: hypothetical protein ENJ32_00990 [Crenotrichaceae bacterium]|nr:hypothetical protein [Crenotrichaceae bacterium]